MKFKFGIRQKVYLGFSLLIVLFVTNAIVSLITLDKNRKLIAEISQVVDPSLESMEEFTLMVNKSKMLSTNWVFMKTNEEDKKALRKLIDIEYPTLKSKILKLKTKWKDKKVSDEMDAVLKDFDKLVAAEEEAISLLPDFESYEDGSILFMAQDGIESQVLPMSAKLMEKLGKISELKKKEKTVYERDLISSSDNLKFSVLGLGVVVVFIGVFAAIFMANTITGPVNKIKDVMKKLGVGELPDVKFEKSSDEIGEMQDAISTVIEGLTQTTEFANKIGKKELDAEYNPLSDKDVLGLSLIHMRDSLRSSDIAEKERAWVMDGSSQVNDILRKYDNVDPLSEEVLQFMVKRINAIQGAFYVVTERDEKNYRNTILEMKSSFAYNRKKYLHAKFRMAEGLVGQAAVEQSTILRTEIPRDYVTITSGLLGDKRPTCIVVVPFIIDDIVYGAVEFAGFHKFEEYEIRFIEEVGPSIARTIYNIQVNQGTKMLLEKSQIMGHELREKQEELLQNAEEMKVTQEELEKSNNLLQEQIEEVSLAQNRTEQLLYNASEVITIYELDGTIRYISPSVKNILGYDPDELIGLKGRTHVNEEDMHKSRNMFKMLLENSLESHTIQYRFQKKDDEWIWLEATGKNLLHDASVKGIVINARDITVKMKAEQEERMRRNMQALSENSPDLITRISVQGKIAYTNPTIELYTSSKAANFTGKMLENVSVGGEVVESWKTLLNEVKRKNENISEEVTYNTSQGKRIMQVNAIPEYNENVLESVLMVAHDITERKEAELLIQDKNKKINESINYSKRIQNAVIPDNRAITRIFNESFIFYHPKDVVSGDFPWMMEKGDEVYIAAVDCTGHGVPGAMLSLVGNFLLNDIIGNGNSLSPAVVLDRFDEMVNKTLNTEKNDSQIKDGMDIALCKINVKTRKLEYAGAHRPLYHVAKGELKEYKGDKWAIGGGIYKNQTNFTNHELHLKKGEAVYIFSDGLPDQFGGPQSRKFSPQRIKEVIIANSGDMDITHKKMKEEFKNWMGDQKQTDDVLLIGIKF
ncbi:MAG TPA: PAS domain S-box protein [Cytophagaceae bacterium]|jgi:PAS domain S-box-containing protein|nr:PAS domain S-box protein [Cytophagaceae bacterium]